jgi:hypothetical protein
MKRLSEGTGIGYFSPGQSLGSQTMNNLNTAINHNTDITNNFLLEYINPNVEENKMTTVYTLSEILPNVPEQRRVPGIKLRFLSATGWKEFIYIPNIEEENSWTNLDYWKEGESSGVIDGGEW